jgi:hypothetical protein
MLWIFCPDCEREHYVHLTWRLNRLYYKCVACRCQFVVPEEDKSLTIGELMKPHEEYEQLSLFDPDEV